MDSTTFLYINCVLFSINIHVLATLTYNRELDNLYEKRNTTGIILFLNNHKNSKNLTRDSNTKSCLKNNYAPLIYNPGKSCLAKYLMCLEKKNDLNSLSFCAFRQIEEKATTPNINCRKSIYKFDELMILGRCLTNEFTTSNQYKDLFWRRSGNKASLNSWFKKQIPSLEIKECFKDNCVMKYSRGRCRNCRNNCIDSNIFYGDMYRCSKHHQCKSKNCYTRPNDGNSCFAKCFMDWENQPYWVGE